MIIDNGGPRQSLGQLVLFPFDDCSLPLQTGLQLELVGHRTPCGRTRVVLGPGPAGAPDSLRVVYYGTVHRVGDELWMWYLGQGHEPDWCERVCLARSPDGYHWERPDLGLVGYRGSRHNNLVDLNQAAHHVQACVVFLDGADPDPRRRFKMAFQSRRYQGRFAVAYSGDGLTWREADGNPRGSHLEMAGGTRLAGAYHLCGQGGHHPGPARKLVTHLSYDFERWSEGFCVGLDRGDPRTRPYEGNSGPQVHLGAGLWNRGNVVVGLYGMWDGHPTGDRRLTTMHLGLAVSPDGLHYREPVRDFPMVCAAEDGWDVLPGGHPTVDRFPALIQGQGFANVGEETLFWYAPWPEQASDGVRVAAWKRDRLGAFRAFGAPDRPHHCVSAPIDLQGRPARLLLNADGLGPHAALAAQVLAEDFAPLPGYGAADFGPLASGLRQPATWRERPVVRSPGGRIRLQLCLAGVRPEDVRLYAAYLESE
ncbi:MAG: hypothetical protein AB1505_13555 [Candidatus Latescibacterota bacterium]